MVRNEVNLSIGLPEECGILKFFMLSGISEQCSDYKRLKTPLCVDKFWRLQVGSIRRRKINFMISLIFDLYVPPTTKFLIRRKHIAIWSKKILLPGLNIERAEKEKGPCMEQSPLKQQFCVLVETTMLLGRS